MTMIERDFVMQGDAPVLKGHFPGNPVVPGVTLMAWCEQLAAELADTPVTVRRWSRVKFLHPLGPGETCRISLQRDDGTRAAFRISTQSRLIATGVLEWTTGSP